MLVHHPDRAPSERLRRALRVKNVEILPTTDPYAALATYCTVAKEVGVSLAILLLAEPDKVSNAAELATLANRYVPRGSVWLFTESPSELVREVRASDLEAWSASARQVRRASSIEDEPTTGRPPQPVGGPPPDGPNLRIAPGSASPEGYAEEGHTGLGLSPDQGETEMPVSEPILTDEELAMLLADDPIEPGDVAEPNEGRTGSPDDEDR